MPIVAETLHQQSGKKPVTSRGVDLNVGRGAAYVMFSPDAWIDKTGVDEAAPHADGEGDGKPGLTLRDQLAKQGPRIRLGSAVDTVAEGIGINVVDPDNTSRDVNSIMIPAGSPCGKDHEEWFSVFEDGQTGVDIVINVGDAKELSAVSVLGRVRISGLPPDTSWWQGTPINPYPLWALR